MNISYSSLILASKSPRRKYLLNQVGLSFSVIPSNIDETSVCLCTPKTYVKKLAELKATDISKKNSENWVIGADTIVCIDKAILGKPKSKNQAYLMLKKLSGKIHTVLTGYCICCKKKDIFFSETIATKVSVKQLSDKEINWYIDTKEPFDKAGAYGIQGIGSFMVKSINGSYTNVVGLPVCEVVEFLTKQGVINDFIKD